MSVRIAQAFVAALPLLLSACGAASSPSIQSGAAALSIAPAGISYAQLHSFTGQPKDGAEPYASLTGHGSTLYGVTAEGGANNDGTVFSCAASGCTASREKLLHSFATSDGINPHGALLLIGGTLYGTTSAGGKDGVGTVFSIGASGSPKFKVLHTFAGGTADGATPYAGLTAIGNTLYGTTTSGGKNGQGTVFAITASGSESVVYSFAVHPDGAFPAAGLVASGNTLYGTTDAGGATRGGTVFSVTTAGTESVLHSFAGGGSDGLAPYGGVILDGTTLYGTTTRGGTAGLGTVFSVTTSGSPAFALLHSFGGGTTDGSTPYGTLIDDGGTFYGTTNEGGAGGEGTVFSITESGSEALIYSFSGGSDGASPWSGVTNFSGKVYGTTLKGGSAGDGTLFSIGLNL